MRIYKLLTIFPLVISCSNNSDSLFDKESDITDPKELSELPGSVNCGDGNLTDDEACDDGNTESDDGCSSNCLIVEAGYSCPTPGELCVTVARCGDGVVVFPEQCDDNNNLSGDGCSPTCKYEAGWKCEGSPSVCSATVCGDGVIEGAESCEDGNAIPFDGCSALCQNEPSCTVGSGCTSICGDGVVINEDCDDGNTIDGDGCSSSCTIEEGYECNTPNIGSSFTVPMIVRDFNAGGDFEKYDGSIAGSYQTSEFGSSFYATQNLLNNTLQNNKPVLLSTTGIYNGTTEKNSGIVSSDSFSMWYDDSSPISTNTRNGSIVTTLLLCQNDEGNAFVNRYGNNGDGLTCEKYQKTQSQVCISESQVAYDADGNVMPCYACYYDSDTSTPECDGGAQACNIGGQEPDTCELIGTDYVGTVVTSSFDGNPTFFPADIITPFSPNVIGQISGNYDSLWPSDNTYHNFAFTSEVRYWFKYNNATAYKLSFVGDDDVWVFINGILAVDIGGIHAAVSGEITISNGTYTSSVTNTNVDGDHPLTTYTSSPDLDLIDGQVYDIAIFHAERQSTASSYQLTLAGFSTAASDCSAHCGDGIVGMGEECDDGINAGGYGKCDVGCVYTEYCGDGVLQSTYEDCDDGNNLDGDGCPSGCRNIVILQ